MHRILHDARFYAVQQEIDEAEARRWHGQPCPHCGCGVLHRADYARSPRGGPAGLPAGYELRRSLCCSECRRRMTPESVRFLGRRWYLAPVVLVLSALHHGLSASRLNEIRRQLADPPSVATLRRWRRWWLERIPATPWWRARRGRLAPPADPSRLPASLVAAFGGVGAATLSRALRFLSPLSTASFPGSLGERPGR